MTNTKQNRFTIRITPLGDLYYAVGGESMDEKRMYYNAVQKSDLGGILKQIQESEYESKRLVIGGTIDQMNDNTFVIATDYMECGFHYIPSTELEKLNKKYTLKIRFHCT